MEASHFKEIQLYPSYGKKSLIIRWKVDSFLSDAVFYVGKARDRGAEYVTLNEIPIRGTTFVDTDFIIPNREEVSAYKIVADKGGTLYTSDSVGVFSRMTRKDFGISQNIIRMKYLQASKGDGIGVLYYPAVKSGEVSMAIDPASGMRYKATCPGDTDMGGYYANGFYRPFYTFIRILNSRQTTLERSAAGEGLDDTVSLSAEFLPFPPVRTGDLIVDVETDNRYLIGKQIQTDMLRGVVPLSYTTTIELQQRSMPVYSFDPPDNYYQLILP